MCWPLHSFAAPPSLWGAWQGLGWENWTWTRASVDREGPRAQWSCFPLFPLAVGQSCQLQVKSQKQDTVREKWFLCSPVPPSRFSNLCSRGCPCSLLHSWEGRRSKGSRACKVSDPTSFPCSGHITNKAHPRENRNISQMWTFCDLIDLSECAQNNYNIEMFPQIPNFILKLFKPQVKCTIKCFLVQHFLTLVNSCRQDRRLWPKSGPKHSCCNTSWLHSQSDYWWPKPAAAGRQKSDPKYDPQM